MSNIKISPPGTVTREGSIVPRGGSAQCPGRRMSIALWNVYPIAR